MIQHTMQEIADFTGQPIAKDLIGCVCIHLFKPIKIKKEWYSGDPDTAIEITSLVSDAATHDWSVLVEPTGPVKCAHCGEVLSVTVNIDAIPVCSHCGVRVKRNMFDAIVEQAR